MNEKRELNTKEMNHVLGFRQNGFPVLKRLISVLLVLILVFTVPISVAEDGKAEGELSEGYAEETKEADRSFTIPVGVGIIYSVIVYKDGVSVVFTPIRNKAAAVGLKTLDFLADVEEIKLYFKDGQSVVFPATVEIKSYDVGTFVALNLSLKTVAAISDLSSVKSVPERVAFVHGDRTEQEMSLDELNQALSDAYGRTVDIANQAGKAVTLFLKKLSDGVRILAADAFESLGKILTDAGQWLSDTASSAGRSINELKDKAGEAFGNALESTGELMENAADTFMDLWSDARGQ